MCCIGIQLKRPTCCGGGSFPGLPLDVYFLDTCVVVLVGRMAGHAESRCDVL